MAELKFSLRDTLLKLLDEKRYYSLRDLFNTMNPADIATVFEDIDEARLPLLFRLLPKELAAETFVEMEPELQELLIRGFSDSELKEVIDELYVDDAVDIVEEMPANVVQRILTQAEPGTIYNVGGNNEKTNLEVVGIILERLGKPKTLIRHVKDRPGHDRRYAIDSGKIMKELGWRPTVTFEEGIVKTIDWYLANTAWLNHIVSGQYQQYYQSMYSNR